jgi:hypothetical protein
MAYGSHTATALYRLSNIKDDTLDLSWLNITSLPPLPNTLKHLNCSYTNLTEILELPPKLESLDCSYTKIKKLPLLPPTLKIIKYNNTKIKQVLTDLYLTSVSHETK